MVSRVAERPFRTHEIRLAQGKQSREAEADGVIRTVCPEATMDADLDTLGTVVYCTADDLLPEARRNARRRLTDAEVVTLCAAQAIMGITSDRRFLATARRRLGHLFPCLPSRPPSSVTASQTPRPWPSSPRARRAAVRRRRVRHPGMAGLVQPSPPAGADRRHPAGRVRSRLLSGSGP